MRGGPEHSKVHAHAIKLAVVNLSCRKVGTNVATKRDTSHDCCRCRSSRRSSIHGVILGPRLAHPRRGWKPEFKLERYPPLDGASCSPLCSMVLGPETVTPFLVVET